MSDVNVNYTIPAEAMGSGEKRTIKRADHGPFYLFSPALPVHRVDMQDSVPHVYPCTLTRCVDWVEMLPEDQCPPGGAVDWRVVKDQVGTSTKVGMCVKSADAQRDLILEMYAGTEGLGLVEISSLSHTPLEQINLELFNSMFYPVKIEPSQLLQGELMTRLEKEGGLAVRRAIFVDGIGVVKSQQFLDDFGSDTQS